MDAYDLFDGYIWYTFDRYIVTKILTEIGDIILIIYILWYIYNISIYIYVWLASETELWMWYLGEKTHWNIVARLKAHLMEVIRCYYPSYTVIANIYKYIQIYPNISNYLHIYIYIYIQIYPNISHNPNCTPKYVHYHVLYILPTAAPVARSFHRPTPMTTRRGSCRPCSDAMLCQYDEDLARIWSLKKKQIS
jgi:hypothetical protein